MSALNFIGCLILHGFRWKWSGGRAGCPICEQMRVVD